MIVTRSTCSCFILLIIVSVTSITVVNGRSWRPSDLPNPQSDEKNICGRKGLKSSICDPDGFLSESEGDTIDGMINFIYSGSNGYDAPICEATSKGPQIALVVVNKMQRIIGENKEDTAYEFAKSIHDEWGVGNKQCQNGLVFFVSISDRAMGVSIGKGLNNVFTNNMVPSFFSAVGVKLKSEQYGPACIYAVNLIGNILSGSANVLDSTSRFSVIFPVSIIMFACFFGMGYYSKMKLNSYQNRYTQCKKLLQKLDTDRSNATRHQYVVTTCPICLEDFEKEDNTNISSSNNKRKEKEKDNKDKNEEHMQLTTSTHNTENNKDNKDKKKIQKTLPCGHSFHEDCVLDWFSTPDNSNATCPICRKPALSNNNNENSADRSLPTSAVGWDQYDDEYRFRINRARFYYPDFITWSMLNNWDSNRHNLNQSMATNSNFLAVDPMTVAAAAAARASGGSGSSFSFGGGSSSGGGGGGGSW